MPNHNYRIAPSILSADFTCLEQHIHCVQHAGADWIHVDIMDGHFVPNLSMGPTIVRALKRCTDLPLDIHLMVCDPDQWIQPFYEAGAHRITFHIEAATHPQSILRRTRDLGCQAGIALNPATGIESLQYLLADIDSVLVMTVNPGFGGQTFLPSQLGKIKQLRTLLDHNQRQDVLIVVDGGINAHTAVQAAQAGAHVFVAGNAIFASPHPDRALQQLRQALHNHD